MFKGIELEIPSESKDTLSDCIQGVAKFAFCIAAGEDAKETSPRVSQIIITA